MVALDRDARPDGVGGEDVVVNLASGSAEVVGPWSAAGTRAGGYLDADPTGASWAHVVAVESPVLPGVGWFATLGEALAAVAGTRLPAATDVDVTAWVDAWSGPWRAAWPRERGELAAALPDSVLVVRDGEPARERLAESRRLAWFPRPVGPHHAAGVAAPHARTVPAILPGARSVRSALALRSWVAEALQAAGAVARWQVRRGRVVDGAPRGRDGDTSRERWALVVEAADGDRLVRAWANGHDRHEVTARVVAATARSLAAGAPIGPGPHGATAVLDAEALLDDLAAGSDLRWSLTG